MFAWEKEIIIMLRAILHLKQVHKLHKAFCIFRPSYRFFIQEHSSVLFSHCKERLSILTCHYRCIGNYFLLRNIQTCFLFVSLLRFLQGKVVKFSTFDKNFIHLGKAINLHVHGTARPEKELIHLLTQ